MHSAFYIRNQKSAKIRLSKALIRITALLYLCEISALHRAYFGFISSESRLLAVLFRHHIMI